MPLTAAITTLIPGVPEPEVNGYDTAANMLPSSAIPVNVAEGAALVGYLPNNVGPSTLCNWRVSAMKWG